MTKLHTIVLLTCLCAALAFATSAVALPPAEVRSANVRVGDLVPGCEGEICTVEVTSSPLPGRTKVVHRPEIISAIEGAGFSVNGMSVPEQRKVTRPSRRVPSGEISAAVERAIRAVLPKDTTLEQLARVSDLELPKGAFEVVARWTGTKDWKRRVAIPVDILVDGEAVRSFIASATLVATLRVPVAAKDLPAGTLLDGATWIMRDIKRTTAGGEIAQRSEDVVGRQTTRVIASGEPFEVSSLAVVPVVRRGDRVAVESIVGLVRISAIGIARTDAAQGEEVQVVLQSAGRLVLAEAVGPGRVKVTP